MIMELDERGKPLYLPDPEEIAELCREIQAGWDRRTERQRREWAICRAKTPVLSVAPNSGADGASEEMDLFNR